MGIPPDSGRRYRLCFALKFLELGRSTATACCAVRQKSLPRFSEPRVAGKKSSQTDIRDRRLRDEKARTKLPFGNGPLEGERAGHRFPQRPDRSASISKPSSTGELVANPGTIIYHLGTQFSKVSCGRGWLNESVGSDSIRHCRARYLFHIRCIAGSSALSSNCA
jgi:hypothetical protein